MPYTTTQPVVDRVINLWQVVAFQARLPVQAGEAPSLAIDVLVGFADGTGAVEWYAPRSVVVAGAALLAAWSQAPEGSTMYDAIKHSLYGYLQASGIIPAGATEHTAP